MNKYSPNFALYFTLNKYPYLLLSKVKFYIIPFQKALNLHHSVLAGRKINVEVTCGGGGKGENRVKKLQQRKLKFQQGRKRRSTTSTKVKSKQKDDTSCNT